jgi:hypothetical protein
MLVSGHRFAIGVGLFVLGFAAPAFIPIVTASHLSSGWKAGISGFLALGLPEIMMIAAAAVMGKSGLAELKRRLGRLLRRYGPSDAVSPTRYRIGLVMFVAPLLTGWLGPYFGDHLPGYATRSLWWDISGDLVFLASFFVLGGDFWDKVRSLFVHRARAVLPATHDASREVSR